MWSPESEKKKEKKEKKEMVFEFSVFCETNL